MKNIILKLWRGFKAPIVWVGMALGALILVIMDARRAGKRAQQIKDLKVKERDEHEKVDAMLDSDDADGLRRDILKRARKRD